MDVYLIPGLGADHRIFSRLELHGHSVHHLDWPVMPSGSGLPDFAAALATQVDHGRPHALLGMSMGGMVAQELAALTAPRGVVIISSWKGPQEMPPPIRLLRGRRPDRLINKAFLVRVMPMIRWQMGVETKDEVALLDAFMRTATIAQLKVQVAAVLAWKGPSAPLERLVHIHGDNDRLMPLAFVRGAQVVRGGSHFMVYGKAERVSALVQQALADLADLA